MKAATKLKLYQNTNDSDGRKSKAALPQPAESSDFTDRKAPGILRELPDFMPVSSGLYSRTINFQNKTNLPQLSYEALQLPTALMGMLDLAGDGLLPGQVLFLDTETTGLSVSTGTLPFLTGLAYVDDDKETLTIEQFFLSSPGGEAELVCHLDRLFNRFTYLCTFNGKSYDVPLIKNRFALQRSTMKVFAHHFDLLHIYRRMFPKDFPGGFRQKNLEASLLQTGQMQGRGEDIDGADIPGIYFDWVKYGIDRGLSKIAEHNELDMHGMVALYALAARLFHEHRTFTNSKPGNTSTQIRVGRILFRNQQYKEAVSMLEPLMRTTVNENDSRILLTTLHQSYTSLGRYHEAGDCLFTLVESQQSPVDLLLLLRFLEYKAKDYTKALQLIVQLQSSPQSLIGTNQIGLSVNQNRLLRLLKQESLERRKSRLENKQKASIANQSKPHNINL